MKAEPWALRAAPSRVSIRVEPEAETGARILVVEDPALSALPAGSLVAVERGQGPTAAQRIAPSSAAFAVPARPGRVERLFDLYSSPGPLSTPPAAGITLLDGIEFEGQESLRIVTATAVWTYHKRGAGFASLRDADGLEWIGYRPGGRSAGEYRGIPNVAPPEFHPGETRSTTRVAAAGPLLVRIESRTDDGAWSCRWDIFATHATMTLLTKPEGTYWVLYEGTPGGLFREHEDTMLLSSGAERKLDTAWEEALPSPEWVAFASRRAGRSLFLLHHEPDDGVDSYWPMEGNMTVFGFGRAGKGKPLTTYLTGAPATFSVGLVEGKTERGIRTEVERLARPPLARVFAVEERPADAS